METAGGLVGLAGEFAARVERAEDDFEGGFVREFRVRIDRDTAAVVSDRDRVVFVQFDFDPVGVASDGFVHRVVEHFGHKVMKRAFVGAADVHAGAFADGFQTLEHLDGGRIIGIGLGRSQKVVCHVICSFLLAILDQRGRQWAMAENQENNGFCLFPNLKKCVFDFSDARLSADSALRARNVSLC